MPTTSTTSSSSRKDAMKASNGSVVVTNKKKKEKAVTYGECRKNHAANIGGYAVDGCREFMASGEEGTSAALRCAACTCHRSFHKRVALVTADPDAYACDCDCDCDCSSKSNS